MGSHDSDADGIPMMPDMDPDEEKAESMQDFAIWADQVNKEEMAKARPVVVPIRKDIKHTDDELIPDDPSELMLKRIDRDPIGTLRESANDKYLIDDLLPASGVAAIYGPPGSYKSFMALDLALSISTGKDWHGLESEMPGTVLYVAAEGANGVRERIAAWCKHHRRNHGPIMLMPIPVMLDSAIEVQALIEALMAERDASNQPIRMIVIDTLARSHSGDENSAKDIGLILNACFRISNSLDNCMVLLVTHTGKDLEKGIRGSSAINGAVYCSFLVTKPSVGQMLVKNTKQKDGVEVEPMRFAMELVSLGISDRKGRERRSLVPILESKGEDADPDKKEETSAFDHKDIRALVGMVVDKNQSGGITEDDLRKEFIDYLISEGRKEGAAARAWQRLYRKARDQDLIMKHGIKISIPDKR